MDYMIAMIKITVTYSQSAKCVSPKSSNIAPDAKI